MSWGNLFDTTGGFAFGNDGVEEGADYGANAGTKRYMEDDSDQMYKRMRDDGNGSYSDSYGGGNQEYGGGNDDQVSWSNMSELTSWNQISTKSEKPKRGRGGRGGGGGAGQFKSGYGGGNQGGYGGNSYGGGSKWDSGGNFGSNEQFGNQGNFGNQGGFRDRGQNYGGNFGGQNFGGRGRGGRGGQGRGGFQSGGRGGRGQDRAKGINRAFVHGHNRNAANMSLVDKFEKYMRFLKGDTLRINAIQSIENACLATGLNLKCDYQVEELPRIYHRQLFTGRLCISGIYLARSVGCNKKEMKHEIYNKALTVLTTKSLTDINELKDPGVDLVRASVEKYLKSSGPGQYTEGVGVPIYKAMADVATEVSKHLDTVHQLQVGLGKVVAILKGTTTLPDNPISKLEQAFIKANSGLRYIFTCENQEIQGKFQFEGCFVVEDTCIARALNPLKKPCKTETYTLAIEALETKSIADLIVPVERDKDEEEEEHVQNEAIVAGVQQTGNEGPPPITKPSLIQAPVQDKLGNLHNVISCSAFSGNNMAIIDNCVSNSGLTAMCIYRKPSLMSEECVACELYMDNILIAEGFGNSKLECAHDAYNTAFEVISNSTPQELITNHKKIEPHETSGPTVLECTIKGCSGVNKESNMAILRRYGFDPEDKTRSMDKLVIVEASDWHKERRGYSFCILQHSASLNGMLLEWNFIPAGQQAKRNYKHERRAVGKMMCEIFLCGNKVSQSSGYGKNKIRNYAAADILYKLYETCDVIRILKQNDSERWIPFTTLSSEADTLRVQAREPKQEPAEMNGEQPMDKFLVQAATQRIDKFFPRSDAEELLFGPGIPQQERRVIREFVMTKGLRYVQRMKDGQVYDVVFEKTEMREMVDKLKLGYQSQYGKYFLVPKSECPKHADLTGPKSTTTLSFK